MAVLELVMGTSENVVAMERKLTTPKVKRRSVIARKEDTAIVPFVGE